MALYLPVCFQLRQLHMAFLWLISVFQGVYRFDGIRFVPKTLLVDGKTIDHIVSVHGDQAGGLWSVGEKKSFT